LIQPISYCFRLIFSCYFDEKQTLMKKELVIEICAALLLMLFTYTAVSKFMDYDRFVFQMGLAPVPFMKTIGPILGWLLPSVEALVAAALIWKKTRFPALCCAFCLLGIFEIYIAAMLLSGLRLPCTCGGVISRMSWAQHLIFNLIFMALAAVAIMLTEKKGISNTVARQDISRA